MYKRVIIKLSGEALAGNSEKNFDDGVINAILDDIVEISKNGTQVSIVVGGGNFWRGRSSDSKMDRTKADQIGMLATVMNAIYLSDTFRQKGVKAQVFTPFKVGTITKEFSKEDALEVLQEGGICIFACGTGHPFFSTDTIAAIRACELECDSILYAKNVDGIYDSDPKTNPNAKKFSSITYEDVIKNDLRAIDIAAMNLSMDHGIESVVFGLDCEGSLYKAVANNEQIFEIGTKITVK